MRKYRALIKMIFLDQLEYPPEVIHTTLISLPQILIMTYLWFTVYATRGNVAGFNLAQIITYYFIALILGRLQAHPAFWVQFTVSQGDLSNYLVKPFSFLKYILTHAFIRRLAYLSIALPIILLVAFLLRQYLLPPLSADSFLLFLLSVAMSICLYYIIGTLIGLVCLWTMEIGSLFYFFYTLLDFLGGATLPLSFFPASIQILLDFLPFKYLYYFPSQIYLGKISNELAVRGLLISAFWVLAISFLTRFVWNRGVRRYSSFGG